MLFYVLVTVAFCSHFQSMISESLNRNDGGDTWIVLVAGANEWSNYWSQADICAAYQQAHQAGVSDDRIIVWMYDDIANSRSNPYPGKVYLYKGSPDFYENVLKDVTGSDITPDNFMKLLRGENMTIGSGKSLQSTSQDRVFIYYSDHGGPGVIYFPGFVEWHQKDVISTLQTMHSNNMYSELVFYLDTCESGSIFAEGALPDDINIYAATSTDPSHSAWLCDCKWISSSEENDFPCTSNCWGKYWMHDTINAMNQGVFGTRTLGDQFEYVKNKTYHDKCYYYPNCNQQACNYGDMDIEKDALDMFQGPGHTSSDYETSPSEMLQEEDKDDFVVPMRLSKLFYLEKLSKKTNDRSKVVAYQQYMDHIDTIWNLFASKMGMVNEKEKEEGSTVVYTELYDCKQKQQVDSSELERRMDCHKDLVTSAKGICGPFDEYSSQYLALLQEVCREGSDERVEMAKDVLEDICL